MTPRNTGQYITAFLIDCLDSQATAKLCLIVSRDQHADLHVILFSRNKGLRTFFRHDSCSRKLNKNHAS